MSNLLFDLQRDLVSKYTGIQTMNVEEEVSNEYSLIGNSRINIENENLNIQILGNESIEYKNMFNLFGGILLELPNLLINEDYYIKIRSKSNKEKYYLNLIGEEDNNQQNLIPICNINTQSEYSDEIIHFKNLQKGIQYYYLIIYSNKPIKIIIVELKLNKYIRKGNNVKVKKHKLIERTDIKLVEGGEKIVNEKLVNEKKNYIFFKAFLNSKNKILYPIINNDDIEKTSQIYINKIENVSPYESFNVKDNKIMIKKEDIYNFSIYCHIVINIKKDIETDIRYKIIIEASENEKWKEIHELSFYDIINKYKKISHCSINGIIDVKPNTEFKIVFKLLNPIREIGSNIQIQLYTGNIYIYNLVTQGERGGRGERGDRGERGERGLRGIADILKIDDYFSNEEINKIINDKIDIELKKIIEEKKDNILDFRLLN